MCVFKASIVIRPEDVDIALGRTLFLPCVVITNNSSSAVSITWQQNGSALDSSIKVHLLMVTEKNGSTIITSVLEICSTVDVGGNYSCKAMADQQILDEETFSINIINGNKWAKP